MGGAAAPREGPLPAQLKAARSAALSCAIMSSERDLRPMARPVVSIEKQNPQTDFEPLRNSCQFIIARQKNGALTTDHLWAPQRRPSLAFRERKLPAANLQ